MTARSLARRRKLIAFRSLALNSWIRHAGPRRIVLSVEVAPGERVELAGRNRQHEPRRALRGRPGSVVARGLADGDMDVWVTGDVRSDPALSQGGRSWPWKSRGRSRRPAPRRQRHAAGGRPPGRRRPGTRRPSQQQALGESRPEAVVFGPCETVGHGHAVAASDGRRPGADLAAALGASSAPRWPRSARSRTRSISRRARAGAPLGATVATPGQRARS
jgi:hypothetical protein